MKTYVICIGAFIAATYSAWADTEPINDQYNYVESNFDYLAPDDTPGWHSPTIAKRQGLFGQDLTQRQSALVPFSPLGWAALIATFGNFLYFQFTAQRLRDDINDIDTTTSTTSTKETATCKKVNEILNIATLTSSQTQLAAVTGFQLTEILVDSSATTLGGTATINGKSLATGNQALIATGTDTIDSNGGNVGITATDFDRFRATQSAALLALQAKVDQILAVSGLSCSG